MKVYIDAASSKENYPTVCGYHEFETVAEAIDFAHYGAKGLNDKADELIIDFNPGLLYKDVDLYITIYDYYVE